MNRSFTACLLKPRGPIHLGDREGMREGSADFIHSDTIFSALCHSYRLLYGDELNNLLQAFTHTSPPLRLTSAFPYYNNTYYFPVPRNCIPEKKEHKKLRFIAQPEFERLLAGKPLSEKPPGLPSNAITRENIPRVSLSRLTAHPLEEGGFYHIGITWFKQGGLFFLIEITQEWEDKVKTALRLMCEEGIGGYRSIGKGQFGPPEWQTLTINIPESPDANLLLSLYYPQENEINGLTEGYYQLIARKGYVFSPDNRTLRRKEVFMFAEGSVFPGNGRKGKLVDVTPDNARELGLPHQVFRYGLAFTIPCRLNVQPSGR